MRINPVLKAKILAIRNDPDLLSPEKAELLRVLLQAMITRNEDLVENN